MTDELERSTRTFGWGYWIAIAAGLALALAYAAGQCVVGGLCH